jgi:hypothetical protein
MEGILPPASALPSSSSSGRGSAAKDSELYNIALEHAGEEGEAALKDLIIRRSQENTIRMISTGATDDARVKAMSSVQDELTAFVCMDLLLPVA